MPIQLLLATYLLPLSEYGNSRIFRPPRATKCSFASTTMTTTRAGRPKCMRGSSPSIIMFKACGLSGPGEAKDRASASGFELRRFDSATRTYVYGLWSGPGYDGSFRPFVGYAVCMKCGNGSTVHDPCIGVDSCWFLSDVRVFGRSGDQSGGTGSFPSWWFCVVLWPWMGFR